MTVTASRLGASPLTVDWSNLIRPIPHADSTKQQAISEAWSKLKSRFETGEIGFFDTPIKDDISQREASEHLARELIAEQRFTDCLFLGIGGSSLGPKSLLSALQERCGQKITFHFVDNPDPLVWHSTLATLKPNATLVCVVTKSGTTFETIAQLLLALNWLGKECYKNLVAITDPAKGDLKAFATKEGIKTLSIATSVGGRFSVFTPVGLFAAALAGLSTVDFLNGAKTIRDYVEKTPPERNVLFLIANELIVKNKTHPVHVCMPYSTRLRVVSDWFVQLWGESLGKDGKGFTPLAAVGATDQHSLLQLLRDGPDDKVTFFLKVDKVENEVTIPRLATFSRDAQYPSFKLLENHSLHELMNIEYMATSMVLTKRGRPNLTIGLDQLDEKTMGALFFAFSVLTAITGTLMSVNPFDQPGVEEGKIYIRDSLRSTAAITI